MFWGIKSVDNALGGLEEGRKYFLYGDSQFDLLAMIITFLTTGLKYNQRAALLTSEAPVIVERVARFLGVNIKEDILKDRFIILQCKPFFGEKLVQIGDASRITLELNYLLGTPLPQRIGIFPIRSMVSQATSEQLMRSTKMICKSLEMIGSTVMAGEVSKKSDKGESYVVGEIRRRLDGTFRSWIGPDRIRQLALEKDWSEQGRGLRWIYFIKRKLGVHAIGSHGERLQALMNPELQRILLVADREEEISRLKQEVEPLFTLEVAHNETEAMSCLVKLSSGLILIALSNSEQAMSFCLYIRKQLIPLPIILISEHEQSAVVRAGILFHGVDDFIQGPYSTLELISRITSILRRSSLIYPMEEIAEYLDMQKHLKHEFKKFRQQETDNALFGYQLFSSALEKELFIAKMARFPCALVALKTEGGDDELESARLLLQSQLGTDHLATLLPNDIFFVFLGLGGAAEARMFAKKLIAAADSRIENPLGRLSYAVITYPGDGTEADALIQAASNKPFAELRHGKI